MHSTLARLLPDSLSLEPPAGAGAESALRVDRPVRWLSALYSAFVFKKLQLLMLANHLKDPIFKRIAN